MSALPGPRKVVYEQGRRKGTSEDPLRNKDDGPEEGGKEKLSTFSRSGMWDTDVVTWSAGDCAYFL